MYDLNCIGNVTVNELLTALQAKKEQVRIQYEEAGHSEEVVILALNHEYIRLAVLENEVYLLAQHLAEAAHD